MDVTMVTACTWQDGGRERPLAIGQVLDLPDPVALAFIAAGRARPVVTEALDPDPEAVEKTAPPHAGKPAPLAARKG